MEAHALEPPQVNEVMDMLEKTRLVVLLVGSLTPEVVRDDLGDHSLAKDRNAGDGSGEVGKRGILEIRNRRIRWPCSFPAFGGLGRLLGGERCSPSWGRLSLFRSIDLARNLGMMSKIFYASIPHVYSPDSSAVAFRHKRSVYEAPEAAEPNLSLSP